MQPTVLFTVLAIVFLTNEAYSAQIFDLKSFLKTLQQQIKQEQDALYKNRHYSNEEEDSYGSLKKSDLENLLSYSSKKSRSNRQNKNSKPQSLSKYLELRRPFQQSEPLIPNDLTGLLNSIKQQNSYYVSSSESDQRDDEENDSPNEYSKVYVVLNSEAVRKSKNQDKLNALLSSLLSEPPVSIRNAKKRQRIRKVRGTPQQLVHYNKRGYQNYDHNLRLPNRYDDDDRQQNEARYKGFLINARRKTRDSKERFDEPMERESRPRNRGRDRGMRGGGRGGGGGSARTAIPYIRHHGDIYERDD